MARSWGRKAWDLLNAPVNRSVGSAESGPGVTMAQRKERLLKLQTALYKATFGTPSLMPTDQPGASQGRQTPPRADITLAEATRTGFKASTWVCACQRKLAGAGSSVPWDAYEKGAKGKWKILPDHPLTELLQWPNPWMTTQDIMARTILHMFGCGNALWFKNRAGNRNGPAKELLPLNPDHIRPIRDPKLLIAYYRFSLKGNFKPENDGGDPDGFDIPVRDIVHFMFENPEDPTWGISPLVAGRGVIEADTEAVKYWRFSMINRAIKDGAFVIKNEMSDEEYDDFVQLVQDQIVGSYNNRGPMVLDADVEYVPFSFSPQELDFMESKKHTAIEICAIHGVPPILVGAAYEQSSYNNMRVARTIFWLDTVLLVLDDIKQTINISLAPDYGDRRKLQADFDTSGVEALQDVLVQKLAMSKDARDLGIPINQIINAFDLPFEEVEGGDEGWIPTGYQKLLAPDPEEDAGGILPGQGVDPIAAAMGALDGGLMGDQPALSPPADRKVVNFAGRRSLFRGP